MAIPLVGSFALRCTMVAGSSCTYSSTYSSMAIHTMVHVYVRTMVLEYVHVYHMVLGVPWYHGTIPWYGTRVPLVFEIMLYLYVHVYQYKYYLKNDLKYKHSRCNRDTTGS